MKDHKLRQQMFHKVEVAEADDWLNAVGYLVNYDHPTDVVSDIIKYFNEDTGDIQYPSKSYAVAIIYAQKLQEFFNQDFYKSLNDPDLLFGNDVFFVTYEKDSRVYDCVLSEISLDFDTSIPQIATTIDYFTKEFYLNDNPYFSNTFEV